MVDQGGGSGREGECALLIMVGCMTVKQILSAVPISKRLVSFQFTPAEQIQLIKEMLADRGEQEAARALKPGDASKLIELLDLVCPPSSFLATNSSRQTGSESGQAGRIDSAYVYSLLGSGLWMVYTPPKICRDLGLRAWV